MEKVACFIHSTTLELHKDTFLIEILEHMKDCNLLNQLTYLYINNTGLKLDEEKIEREYAPASVVHCFDNTNEFENPTIKLLHSFCVKNPDYKILYMHTKGVSYSSDHVFLPGIKSWNWYMRHCLLDYFTHCLTLLRIYDTVGCNYRPQDCNPQHYSGNYWWASARYIRTLLVAYLKDKYDPEFWLLQNNPLYFNILTLEDMYQEEHPIENYRLAVKHGIEDNILFCNATQLLGIGNAITLASAQYGNKIVITGDFLKEGVWKPSCDVLDFHKCNELLKSHKITLIYKNNIVLEINKVEYGLLNLNTIDITDPVISRFLHDNHLFIPIGTSLNDLFSDPCPGRLKEIYVHYSLNSIPCYKIYYERNLKKYSAVELKYDLYDGKPTSSVNTCSALTDSKEMSAEFDMFLSKLILCII